MASTTQPAGKVPDLVYQCYAAMVRELGIFVPPADAASQGLSPEDRLVKQVEAKLEVTQLRAFLQKAPTDDQTVAALIRWIMARQPRVQSDTDMLELLLVQYVALTAPAGRRTALEDAVTALAPVIGTYVPFAAASRVADSVERLDSAATLLDLSAVMQQLRKLKAACDLSNSSALMVFAWFSFSFRRRFIGLLRDEVERVERLMGQLEREGVQQIDASNCGMSAALNFQQLRNMCTQWHKPFGGNYSQGAWYEQVTNVRVILEKAQEEVSAAELAMAEGNIQHAAQEEAQQQAVAPKTPAPAAPVLQVTPAQAPAPGPVSASIPLEFSGGPAAAEEEESSAFDESAFAATDAAEAAALTPESQVATIVREIESQLVKQKGAKTSAVTRVEVSGVKMMLSPDEVTCFRDSKTAERDLIVRSVGVRVLVLAAAEQAVADPGVVLDFGNQEAEAVRQRTAEVAQDNLELAAMLTGSSRALQKALDKLGVKMGLSLG